MKDLPSQSSTVKLQSLSSEARAHQILVNDTISFDSKLHVFNVKGGSGITRVVSLFPKVSCSCPSTNECYHIVAARMFLGMTVPCKSVKRNLSQLRKNSRTRREIKSGRKRPRPNDVTEGIFTT